MTKKEYWILNYLRENSNYANGNAIEFISPTAIGNAYGLSIESNGDHHSSSASPVLLKLVKLGLAIRNKKGHYKVI